MDRRLGSPANARSVVSHNDEAAAVCTQSDTLSDASPVGASTSDAAERAIEQLNARLLSSVAMATKILKEQKQPKSKRAGD